MNKTIVAIYADSQKWMAVEIRRNRQTAAVVRWSEHSLPPAGLTGELIREKWRESHFAGNKVVCLLPPEWVSYRLLQFPQLPPEQLEAALRLEFETKNIYYKVLEIKNIDQTMEVRIVHIDAVAVQNYAAPLEAAGLEICWLGWIFQGLHGFLNFHREYFDKNLPRLCLYGSDATLEFEMFDEEKLLYRRDFGFGLAELKSEPEVFGPELLEELRLSLVSARKLFGNLSEKLWVFGQWPPDLNGLERITAELQLKMAVPSRTRLGGLRLDELTPRLAALLGIALDELGWDSQETWRLQTKAQVLKEMTRRRLLTGFKAAAVLVLIGCGVWLGLMGQSIKNEKNRRWIAARSQQLDQLNALNLETQQSLKRIASLEGWLEGRSAELEFLRELQEHLPEGTTIEDLMLEDGHLKNLSGRTPSVSLLLKKFQNVPALRGLKLKGSITVTQSGNEQFQLEGMTKVKERSP